MMDIYNCQDDKIVKIDKKMQLQEFVNDEGFRVWEQHFLYRKV